MANSSWDSQIAWEGVFSLPCLSTCFHLIDGVNPIGIDCVCRNMKIYFHVIYCHFSFPNLAPKELTLSWMNYVSVEHNGWCAVPESFLQRIKITVRCPYNRSMSPKLQLMTARERHTIASYGVSFLDSMSDSYSTSVTAVMYAISCYIGPR